jgi:hypothetical protein
MNLNSKTAHIELTSSKSVHNIRIVSINYIPGEILVDRKTFASWSAFVTFGIHCISQCSQDFLNHHTMMKNILFPAFVAMLFVACQNDHSVPSKTDIASKGLSLQLEANPEWQYQNLRLYPVVAGTESANNEVSHIKTLAEAMNTPGFRVLERKQFGRSNDTWYHGVTVQNKTQDTILIMSGDVVTGGNQDRVMAYHDIILPGTVKNVEVFCVEAGRSHYYDQSASPAEKSVGAFKGYYNVASPQVRRAIQSTGNQEEVWAAVAKVTDANGATSNTKAYAALETANEQKAERDAYLRFFEDKFRGDAKVVGVVAVCGETVLGVDIFGDAGLFQRQFPALLHGYVAEAAVAKKQGQMDENAVQAAFGQVAKLAASAEKATEAAGKFSFGGQWVHLYKK